MEAAIALQPTSERGAEKDNANTKIPGDWAVGQLRMQKVNAIHPQPTVISCAPTADTLLRQTARARGWEGVHSMVQIGRVVGAGKAGGGESKCSRHQFTRYMSCAHGRMKRPHETGPWLKRARRNQKTCLQKWVFPPSRKLVLCPKNWFCAHRLVSTSNPALSVRHEELIYEKAFV